MWPKGWDDEPRRYSQTENPYIAHRMTVQVGFDKVACDCGEPFDHIVDLERHQQAFRHPGISSGWQDIQESFNGRTSPSDGDHRGSNPLS